jgi:hypothetical protein
MNNVKGLVLRHLIEDPCLYLGKHLVWKSVQDSVNNLVYILVVDSVYTPVGDVEHSVWKLIDNSVRRKF